MSPFDKIKIIYTDDKDCRTCEFEPEWTTRQHSAYRSGYCKRIPSIFEARGIKQWCDKGDPFYDLKHSEDEVYIKDCALWEAKG